MVATSPTCRVIASASSAWRNRQKAGNCFQVSAWRTICFWPPCSNGRAHGHHRTSLPCSSFFQNSRSDANKQPERSPAASSRWFAIGRTLMAEPELIMLDEPSLGLAPVMVDAMFEAIAALNRRGMSILLVEQNVSNSLELASRAYVLENGAVVLEGAGRALLEDDRVRRAYLGLV